MRRGRCETKTIMLLFRTLSLAIALLVVRCQAEVDASKSWTLYHSFNGGVDFAPRGTVKLSIVDDSEVNLEVENTADCLTEAAIESLLQQKWYQLKLVEDNNDEAPPILTSVPSCQVRRANFRYV